MAERKRRRRRLRSVQVANLPEYRPRKRRRRHRRWRWLRAQRRRLLTVGWILAALLAAGWFWATDTISVEERVEQALALAADGAVEEAVAELKQALLEKPSDPRARWELGQALLELGSGAGALKELQRAEALGFEHPALLASKLTARLLQGQYQDALRQLAFVANLDSDPLLLELQARARLGLGELDAARRGLESILEAWPEQIGARLWLGRVALRQADLELAESQAAALLAAPSPSPDAWILRGEIDLARGEPGAAQRAFETASEATRGSLPAELGIVRSLLAQRRSELAATRLDALLVNAPDHPVALFLRAQAAAQLGDDAVAIANARRVVSRFPQHPPSLLLLGVLHLGQGELAQAEHALARLVSLTPGDRLAAKLLAAVEIQSGNGDAAAARLTRLAEGTQDREILSLLGAAYVRGGRVQEARALLIRALELAAADPGRIRAALRTELALAALVDGNEAAAVAQLRAAVVDEPGYARASILLATVQIAQARHEAGKGTLRELLGRDASNVSAWHLLAVAQMAENDIEAAGLSLDRALAIAPGSVPVLWSRAHLASAAGDSDAARAGYRALLQRDPEHVAARLELAGLEEVLGDRQAARSQLETVLSAEPSNSAALAALGRVEAASGSAGAAIRHLEAAVEADPGNVTVALALADLSVDARDYARAVALFAKLLAGAPDDPGLRIRATLAGNLEGGADSRLEGVAEALGTLLPEPAREELELVRQGVDALRRRDWASARTLSAGLTARYPESPSGALLLADLQGVQGAPGAALAALEDAAERWPSRALLARLVAGFSALGVSARSEEHLRRWLNTAPGDTAIRGLLAGHLLLEGRAEEAAHEYEAAAAAEPGNAAVLNNLAWAYHLRGDNRALQIAEDAFRIAPDLDGVADTYGWLLVEAGRAVAGRDVLRRAREQTPADPEVRYHLAVALVRTDERDEAREILLGLNAEHRSFASQEEARSLLARIGPG